MSPVFLKPKKKIPIDLGKEKLEKVPSKRRKDKQKSVSFEKLSQELKQLPSVISKELTEKISKEQIRCSSISMDHLTDPKKQLSKELKGSISSERFMGPETQILSGARKIPATVSEPSTKQEKKILKDSKLYKLIYPPHLS
ncbi:hypothetical protein CEXT_97161 [Caerostris extrusa]|uniref:Uncharacterized protein n=1 Tax=Caerostris extrusa TaxID=172846 RepID=A0AAV4NHD2_CAEEX|nr:hypothetical protein CEXT_97161 [Caerostris extrusa]